MSVLKVAKERWLQAQRWELGHWQNAQRKRGWKKLVWPLAAPFLRLAGSPKVDGDDWNLWWAEKFDQYGSLPPQVDHLLELGCGPYTNARIIQRTCKAARTICSDPLIRDYLTFSHRWLARAYRNRQILIDDHPVEECPFRSDYFDVVVMINVLDHVMDADLCMQQAVRITKPGGFLVIGQDLSSEEDIRMNPFDEGHPIRLSLEDVERHLAGFKPVLRKVLSVNEGRNPQGHHATLVLIATKAPV